MLLKIKLLIYVLTLLLPWPLRRLLYVSALFKWSIHPTARIGLAIVSANRVVMGERSIISNLTVIRGLENLVMDTDASIGCMNWITGFRLGQNNGFFAHVTNRDPSLYLGVCAAITNQHVLDCTDRLTLGNYASVGGFRTQILTHAADLVLNRQDCKPVTLGAYSLVSTACVILPGTHLADYSIVSAGSMVNFKHSEPYTLYGGVPAKSLKPLSPDMKYFTRTGARVV